MTVGIQTEMAAMRGPGNPNRGCPDQASPRPSAAWCLCQTVFCGSAATRLASCITHTSHTQVMDAPTADEQCAQDCQASSQSFTCGCGKTCLTSAGLQAHKASCQRLQAQEERLEAAAAAAAALASQQETSASECAHLSTEQVMQQSLASLAEVRMGGVSREAMQKVKRQFREILEHTKQKVRRTVGSSESPEVADVVESVATAWEGVCRRDAELDFLDSSDAFIAPTKRYLGDDKEGTAHYAYDSDAAAQLAAIWKHKPKVWADVKTSMERWTKRGLRTSDAYDPSWTFSDTPDGVEFGRFIHKLELQEGETPLVFILYYDGLEVVNGLGQARGTHKLACFYWALVNINQMDRFHNIYLATVCLEKDVARFGPEVVIGGRPGENMAESSCWAAQMQRMRDGITLPTPDGPRFFRGGTAILAADTPAAAELAGTKQGVGPKTYSICRCCHCLQHGDPPPFRAPNSFLSGLPGWAAHCGGRSCKFKLRSSQDLAEYALQLLKLQRKEISAAALAKWMQARGVNSFQGALRGVPCWSVFTGAPMDAMHVVLEGVSRNLLSAIWYFMVREWGLKGEDLVAEIAKYAKSRGIRKGTFPFINEARLKIQQEGQAGGLPHSDCAFPGTAAQIMHLVLASLDIFSTLLPTDALGTPEWQCLVQHVYAVEIIMQRSITMEDLVALDRHIWTQDTLLLLSPKLRHLWKPKNHYFSHIPLDILRWGPPRLFWCMLFEHENQFFKRAATRSNFANVLWSCAQAKARRCVLELIRGIGADEEDATLHCAEEDVEEVKEKLLAEAVFRFNMDIHD